MQTIIHPRIQSQYLKHFHIRSKCKVFGSAKTFGMLQSKKSATISFNSICSLYYFYNLFIHLSFFHLNAFIKFSSLRWHFCFFSLFPIFCLFCFNFNLFLFWISFRTYQKKLFGIRRNSAHITCYTAHLIDGKQRKTEQLTFQKLSYDCCYTEKKTVSLA